MKTRAARPGPPADGGQREKRRRYVVLAVLVVAVIVVFGRTTTYEFVEFDDALNVYENPAYHPLSLASVGGFWLRPYKGLYIPLSFTFYAAEALVSPRTPPDDANRDMSPTVFHAGNVLLHGVCVLMVFVLLRRLVSNDMAAAFGSLLFALHPLQVESVAWISQTRGLLCGAFGLAAIWCYVRSAKDGRLYYAAATACFVLALLSKPAAVSIPFVAAVIDVGLLRHSWRRTALTLAPWLAMAVAVALITKGVQPGFDLPATSLVQRICVAGDSLAFYGVKVIAPLNLAPIYDRPLDHLLQTNGMYWSSLALAAVIGIAAVLPVRRIALVSVALFAAALLPQLGLVPFEYQGLATVADRYAYLAMFGPALAAAAWLAAYPARNALAAAAVVAVGLGWLSFSQASHWQSDETLFPFAVLRNPHSAEMYSSLGNVAYRKGDMATAERAYRAALQIRPQHAIAHRNLGLVFDRRGEWSAAIDQYRQATAARPDFADAYRSLGQTLVKADQLLAAVEAYRKTLALEPDNRPDYAELGVTLLKLHRAAEAETFYRDAVARFPDWPHAHANLAVALAVQGKYAEAAVRAREALALNPGMTEARDTLDKVEGLMRQN